MEDFKKKDKNCEIFYKSVNELAEKLFIENWRPREINNEVLWINCVHAATDIYFNYKDVIEIVNEYIHQQDIEIKKDKSEFLEEKLTELKKELEEYKNKKG